MLVAKEQVNLKAKNDDEKKKDNLYITHLGEYIQNLYIFLNFFIMHII